MQQVGGDYFLLKKLISQFTVIPQNSYPAESGDAKCTGKTG
jgi:hypothetical protein